MPKAEKLNRLFQTCFLIFFLSSQFLPLFLNSQPQNQISHIQSLIDSTKSIYGSSDLLVNGSVYYQHNRLASGTPFLFSTSVDQSTVFTRGKSFQGVGLNYDIVGQKLILLTSMPGGARLNISLSDILIDSFLIKDQLYVNPAKINIRTDYPYLMLVNKDTYSMFVGYKKEFVNRYNSKNPYGKFSSTKQTLFLSTDSTLIRINSKKTLLNTFPSARKAISEYLRKNKIKLLKATPEQLKLLMEFYNHQRELTDG